MRPAHGIVCGLLLFVLTGCGPVFTQKAVNGITFYCPGAGTISYGDRGLRDGLEAAGYQGDVATLVWTVAPAMPIIDQVIKVNAKLGAVRLASHIKKYIEEYPGRPVNVVGLSAGTGVAMWALEELKGEYQVDNVVLLGSSLSHNYDIAKALPAIKGSIYVYYSSHDFILAGPMKLVGTIDGKLGVDGAGAVGLHPPTSSERVVNIAWRRAWKRYGYVGGHMDSTAPRFVEAVLSRHLISPVSRRVAARIPAMPPARYSAAARSDRSAHASSR